VKPRSRVPRAIDGRPAHNAVDRTRTNSERRPPAKWMLAPHVGRFPFAVVVIFVDLREHTPPPSGSAARARRRQYPLITVDWGSLPFAAAGRAPVPIQVSPRIWCPSPRGPLEIARAIEAHDDNHIWDLHLWRVGRRHLAAIVSVVTPIPRDPAHYRAMLASFPRLTSSPSTATAMASL